MRLAVWSRAGLRRSVARHLAGIVRHDAEQPFRLF
jgi:hypothetical protein